ncbi:MAG: tryptophan synthase subunit alpha [Planctomycetaceae bacterium]
MSRIAEVFQSASRAQRMTFMPFVTAGDPSTEGTAAVLKALRDADVDLIELGFPYSDPIADGPVIQASYTRALDSGVTVSAILDMMTSLKNDNLPPVLAMVSFAIIFRFGSERFVKLAAESGFSGLIIPDLPADEAEDIQALARANGLDLVQLVAPTTAPARVQQILNASTGFVYCVSVAGTTGVRRELPPELIQQLQQLRQSTSLPLAVGFGISGPDQVPALQGVADGVIVGSAIVRQISEAPTVQAACDRVREFSQAMRTAVGSVKPSLVSTT